MRRLWGWAGLLAVLLGGAAFAAANAGRMVIIDLGFVTLYRVPLTFVAFGGMVVGMGVMLLAGIHSDLKVRALLRQRREATTLNPPASSFRYGKQGDGEVESRPGYGGMEDESPSGESPADEPGLPPRLSGPPPDVPESWDRSQQSELPIE